MSNHPENGSQNAHASAVMSAVLQQAHLKKRNGEYQEFNAERIRQAIRQAFLADRGQSKEEVMPEEQELQVVRVTQDTIRDLEAQYADGVELTVEMVQDFVERSLMKDGFLSTAKRYILYREGRHKARQLRGEDEGEGETPIFYTTLEGKRAPLDLKRIRKAVIKACEDTGAGLSPDAIIEETIQSLYDGVRYDELNTSMILAARSKVEQDSAYTYVAAHLLLNTIYETVFKEDPVGADMKKMHATHFHAYMEEGVREERLSPDLLGYNIEKLGAALQPERDGLFSYLAIQTLFDRYLIRADKKLLEVPQYFWMRVAMGLALNEKNKDDRAIDFYNVLSTFNYVSSTPTLFNAGTCHPQLSSCYLLTVQDDLEGIFEIISHNAKLSKWSGGLGNDWTNVRATGARIKGTNGRTQGVIPFLKVANDTAVAVNQGGKRKGALCSYLETWHLDIEDFLELRKNTGDDRRRTHDMNTANWIPDLFMKRVKEDKEWTLFNPSDVKDLHDLYGRAFEKRYEEYEQMVANGQIRLFKKVEAKDLWRKMLTMLFETGHPWITFKDPSNIRSPQDHMGVVHSSNLCTEILLNTSKTETAVCNLGSINLVAHMGPNGLDEEKIKKSVMTAVRMLDNVIDINYYPTDQARNANSQHRPIGLGIMGFQDALYLQGISYASEAAVEFADSSMEMISYYAILASTELARERGKYGTYAGSKWDRGLLPIDTVDLLEQERGSAYVSMDKSCRMDWTPVREAVKMYGMRNSNTMAIAPTATISNIANVSQSIEPAYSHLFVKSNLSGEFTVLNVYLEKALKEIGLWDADMVEDLKYFDGSLSAVDRVPDAIKQLFLTAFEIDPKWMIECASRRQKWIDMGQSLNLYIAAPNGRKLHEMYMYAWERGLKTTYYLRSLAATQVEKSTVDINKRGIQPRWMKSKSASSNIVVDRDPPATAPAKAVTEEASASKMACNLLDPTCESCQ
jgi:ribonucleoside-diphosphate reductase alpha chain